MAGRGPTPAPVLPTDTLADTRDRAADQACHRRPLHPAQPGATCVQLGVITQFVTTLIDSRPQSPVTGFEHASG
ncbi:MAG: hypothetical protein JWR48_5687 [Mycobacterium sp.]|jgi:hypothetical protein|nr:hypothetical protein [Mycobacterium sp.]